MHVISVSVAVSHSLRLFLASIFPQGSKAVCVCSIFSFFFWFNCKTICKLIIVICTRQFVLRIRPFKLDSQFVLAGSIHRIVWQSAQLALFYSFCFSPSLPFASTQKRLFKYRICTFTKSQRWRRRYDIFFFFIFHTNAQFKRVKHNLIERIKKKKKLFKANKRNELFADWVYRKAKNEFDSALNHTYVNCRRCTFVPIYVHE